MRCGYRYFSSKEKKIAGQATPTRGKLLSEMTDFYRLLGRFLYPSPLSCIFGSSLRTWSWVLTPPNHINTRVTVLTPVGHPVSINVSQSLISLHVNNLLRMISIYVWWKPKPERRIWFLVCLSRIFKMIWEDEVRNRDREVLLIWSLRLQGMSSIFLRIRARSLKGVGSYLARVKVKVSFVCIATGFFILVFPKLFSK